MITIDFVSILVAASVWCFWLMYRENQKRRKDVAELRDAVLSCHQKQQKLIDRLNCGLDEGTIIITAYAKEES